MAAIGRVVKQLALRFPDEVDAGIQVAIGSLKDGSKASDSVSSWKMQSAGILKWLSGVLPSVRHVTVSDAALGKASVAGSSTVLSLSLSLSHASVAVRTSGIEQIVRLAKRLTLKKGCGYLKPPQAAPGAGGDSSSDSSDDDDDSGSEGDVDMGDVALDDAAGELAVWAFVKQSAETRLEDDELPVAQKALTVLRMLLKNDAPSDDAITQGAALFELLSRVVLKWEALGQSRVDNTARSSARIFMQQVLEFLAGPYLAVFGGVPFGASAELKGTRDAVACLLLRFVAIVDGDASYTQTLMASTVLKPSVHKLFAKFPVAAKAPRGSSANTCIAAIGEAIAQDASGECLAVVAHGVRRGAEEQSRLQWVCLAVLQAAVAVASDNVNLVEQASWLFADRWRALADGVREHLQLAPEGETFVKLQAAVKPFPVAPTATQSLDVHFTVHALARCTEAVVKHVAKHAVEDVVPTAVSQYLLTRSSASPASTLQGLQVALLTLVLEQRDGVLAAFQPQLQKLLSVGASGNPLPLLAFLFTSGTATPALVSTAAQARALAVAQAYLESVPAAVAAKSGRAPAAAQLTLLLPSLLVAARHPSASVRSGAVACVAALRAARTTVAAGAGAEPTTPAASKRKGTKTPSKASASGSATPTDSVATYATQYYGQGVQDADALALPDAVFDALVAAVEGAAVEIKRDPESVTQAVAGQVANNAAAAAVLCAHVVAFGCGRPAPSSVLFQLCTVVSCCLFVRTVRRVLLCHSLHACCCRAPFPCAPGVLCASVVACRQGVDRGAAKHAHSGLEQGPVRTV